MSSEFRTMRSFVGGLLAAGCTLVSVAAAHANVAISTAATSNMSCSAGVCSPTAKKAVLNVDDLATMLASGDVAVKSTSVAQDIEIDAALSWTSTHRLTLDGYRSITFNKPLVVAGTGALTITTNDGGSGGDLMFEGKGNIKFWDTASSLFINGNSYTLVKDIATLASDIAANHSGFYALANDYDASVDGTYTSAPITTELSGTFEGLGHQISNLIIVSSDLWIGLFAEAGGTLRDLGLLNVTISGGASGAGSLMGKSDLAKIIGCYGTGSIVISVGSAVGGLVGTTRFSSDGTIARSHASVDVSAPDGSVVGGLVGASGFSISFSYASGRVEAGDNSSAGGLFGTGGNVTQSYATGSVVAGDNSNVGGLVGAAGGSVVTNDYATGSVKGGNAAIVGGFAGNTGDLSLGSSYSLGLVKSPTGGGFLGSESNNGFPSKSYWDVHTSGKSKHQGCGNGQCGPVIKGLTTAQFQSGLPAGFDPAIWGEKASINDGFPYLIANPPPQ